MSNKKQLSATEEQKLIDNTKYVSGVLDLLFCAISSEHPIDEIVLPVISDAQGKMKEIEEAVDILTA